MNNLVLHQGKCDELIPFPHVIEFSLIKNTTTVLNSFNTEISTEICFYYIWEGKFEWLIDEVEHTLYPGDLAIILPGQKIGGVQSILNIGTFTLMKIIPDCASRQLLGKWAGLKKEERSSINRILTTNKGKLILKAKDYASIFSSLQSEFTGEAFGHFSRINHLLSELFILACRQIVRQSNSRRDFPDIFLRIEQTLRQNLAHQWTVDEMSSLAGMGTTTFTEKVKNYSGFSPLNYLINIRISEAIKLLKQQEVNVTDIAMQTGFYSSQHFATTFKKLTGYTPTGFRKNNILNL